MPAKGERAADRNGRRRFGLIAVAMAMLALPGNGLAQSAPPSSMPPGSAPTREELNRAGQAEPSVRRPGRLTVEGDLERAPCPLADVRYKDVTTRFSAVQFDGLRGIGAEALADSWSDLANRDVPIAALCTIRDRAATALRAMGYLAAVQVPPQRIEQGGTVRFDVLMARLVGIEVRGDAGRSERLIAAHLGALKGQPVFNSREAERQLLLVRDLPGYDVRLTLRPAGTAPGEVIGEVRVTHEPVRLDVNVQNLGSRALGRFGGLARLQLNDLTGMGDSTSLSLYNTAQTHEQTVLQLGHSMALGHDGLRLSGDFTYAWTKPDIGADVRSDTLIASVGLSWPLVRRQARNLILGGGLDIVDQKVDFAAFPLSEDHLRVLYLRADAEWRDPASMSSVSGYSAAEPRWRLAGSVELRHGLGMMGASDRNDPLLSRFGADPSAFVARAQATGEWRPVPTFTLALAPRAQYSAQALLSFEEMSAGNYTVGRGYDPGVIAGDRGVGFAAEARIGSLMPHARRDLALQPFAFLDAAWMWNKDPFLTGPDPMKVMSAGGGVRGALGNLSRFDLTAAAPLRDRPHDGRRGDLRLLFSITTQLWPWRL